MNRSRHARTRVQAAFIVAAAAVVAIALPGPASAQSITVFPLPTPGSRPVGIAAGPDGNLWAAEYDANQIARITPSGRVTEFVVPTTAAAPFECWPGRFSVVYARVE